MSVPAGTIRLHLRYSAWASARLVDAASKLSEAELNRDFQHADRSVLGTLVHTFAADRVWLGRIHGAAPRFIDPDVDMRMEALLQDWPKVQEGWAQWAAAQTDTSILEPLSYKDLKGNPYQTPLWQVVLHVVNHATHHRGQVSAMLRAMGHAPPAVDLIHFYRTMPLS